MAKFPKREEKTVIECLKIQGFHDIRYEPDGNFPPDILLDEKIAIEVRRLNENYIENIKPKGLEQDVIKIHRQINSIIDNVSDKHFEKSALISYSFKRPLPDKKDFSNKLTQILENHKPFIHERRKYEITSGFEIIISPSGQKLQKQFEYLLSLDLNSGGFTLNLIYDNLKLIVAEKEHKIKPFRNKYPEWWLAVVDTIGYGISERELQEFKAWTEIKSDFSKLLLVSPLNPNKFVYLYE